MSASFQLVAENPSEKVIHCLKLINIEMDLSGMYKLVSEIEQTQNEKLLQWQNSFTTSFFREIKAEAKSRALASRNNQMFKDIYRKLLTINNFRAFCSLYDQFSTFASSEEYEWFFEFCSSKKFMLIAPAAEVLSELAKVAEARSWKTKVDFVHGVAELIKAGVQRKAIDSYVQQSYAIDPAPNIRDLALLDPPPSTNSDPSSSKAR